MNDNEQLFNKTFVDPGYNCPLRRPRGDETFCFSPCGRLVDCEYLIQEERRQFGDKKCYGCGFPENQQE